MHVTGRCSCGYVQYEAEVNEGVVGICHCTSCQSNSGSAYRSFTHGDEESFKLVSGKLSNYEHVADSRSKRLRPFCPECGTQIYGKSAFKGGLPGLVLRVGTIDQRNELVPKFQIWCRSAQPWAIIDGLPGFEAQPQPDEVARILAK